MTSGGKVALWCGGLGCLGIVGVIVLALLLPPPTKEQQERWNREREQAHQQRAAVKGQREIVRRQREVEAGQQRQAELGREEEARRRRAERSFLLDRYGQPISLTQALFDASRQGPASWEGKVFPERNGIPWRVDQIIRGRWGRRFVTYEFSSGTNVDRYLTNNRFAIELGRDEDLPLTGSFLIPGCFRYEGVFGGKNLLGTVVTIPGFRRVELDHPACRLPEQVPQ